MVNFELRHIGDTTQLIMKHGDKEITIRIYRPLIGRHARPLPKLEDIPEVKDWSFIESGLKLLDTPLHDEKPSMDRAFPSLGRRIISGEVKWGVTLNVNGQFRHPLKYCEWAEDVLNREGFPLRAAQIYDAVHASIFTYNHTPAVMRALYEAWCPETNSLHTSAGEISITPGDLHIIGALPIIGEIYDEATPYPDELRNTKVDDDSSLPPSCRFLFLAFYELASLEKRHIVTPADWVKFWFKGASKYKRLRLQPLTKFIRPNKTSNPSGAIDSVEDWSKEMKVVFTNLGVPNALFDGVYLAAFLSCWLCTFVFPERSTASIRPTTFKPASMLASGHILGLVIPVLANIYKGLNTIANSSNPGSSFPQHYLVTWMDNYFGMHHRLKQLTGDSKMSEFSGDGGFKLFSEEEARAAIHSGRSIFWNATSFVKRELQPLLPSRRPLNVEQRGRFAAMRPCMLSLRWKDVFILEPYNPHRFS